MNPKRLVHLVTFYNSSTIYEIFVIIVTTVVGTYPGAELLCYNALPGLSEPSNHVQYVAPMDDFLFLHH